MKKYQVWIKTPLSINANEEEMFYEGNKTQVANFLALSVGQLNYRLKEFSQGKSLWIRNMYFTYQIRKSNQGDFATIKNEKIKNR